MVEHLGKEVGAKKFSLGDGDRLDWGNANLSRDQGDGGGAIIMHRSEVQGSSIGHSRGITEAMK